MSLGRLAPGAVFLVTTVRRSRESQIREALAHQQTVLDISQQERTVLGS